MERIATPEINRPLEPLTEDEKKLRNELERYLRVLSEEIGERHFRKYDRLVEAEEFIVNALKKTGYTPRRHEYEIEGMTFRTHIAEIEGASRPDEIIVVGAHYDSVPGCPAANDNGTGVAGTLALARAFAKRTPARTVRFVFFPNEEPPFFQTDQMGSVQYARRCANEEENIVGMICLETIGYFTDEPGSQDYPFAVPEGFPDAGDFIGFVGNHASEFWTRQAVNAFCETASLPVEAIVLPEGFPDAQMGWSDHWAFWIAGYPAVLVTDTAPFRYPWYHTPEDTIDKIDFDGFTRVVSATEKTLEKLSQE